MTFEEEKYLNDQKNKPQAQPAAQPGSFWDIFKGARAGQQGPAQLSIDQAGNKAGYDAAGAAITNNLGASNAAATSFFDQAAGKSGPSAAEKQMQLGQETGQKAIAGQAAQQALRGGGGLANLNAMNATADMSASNNANAGVMRAGESIAARQAGLGALGLSQGSAGQLGSLAGSSAAATQGAQQLINTNQANNRQLDIGQQNANTATDAQSLANKNYDRQNSGFLGFMNNTFGPAVSGLGKVADIGSSVAQMVAKSDVRAKKDVDTKGAAAATEYLLNSIQPAKFQYKDPADGPGEHVGVLAQSLTKTPEGRSMLMKDKDGMLHVNAGQAALAALAATKMLHDKMKAKV